VNYLDTSVIIPLFLGEARSLEAEALCANSEIIVSDLASAEFSSALGLAARSRRLSEEAAHKVLAQFDAWIAQHAAPAETLSEDFSAATIMLRRFDLGLRTPDALHIAIAARLGAKLLTFDAKMTAAATALGLDATP
jgi:predicted nucleic acid-binding protein